MAFDHSEDLPPDYPFEIAWGTFCDPELLRQIHDTAEKNFMNKLGHRAVAAKVGRVYGPQDQALANMGAMLYEASTDPVLVGGDFVGTPTWCDPQGSLRVRGVVNMFLGLDGFDLEATVYAALKIMEEDAPQLDELLGTVIGNTVTFSAAQMRGVKAGASLMRTLHITVQNQAA